VSAMNKYEVAAQFSLKFTFPTSSGKNFRLLKGMMILELDA
jgi:hypothetical protein